MRTLVALLTLILVIGTVPAAIAQTAAPLVADGLSLPRDHQYERYDPAKSTYTKVDVSQVPALVKQKQPIFDRTAKAWVYNSPKGLDPRYAAKAAPAAAPTATAPVAKAPAPGAPAAPAPTPSVPATTAPPATTPADPPVVADGLSLPRDRQYERYTASTSAYGKVDVSQVPALVKQKVPIYDRTAKAWVLSPDGKLDPRYTAGVGQAAAPSTKAPAGEWQRIHGKIESVQGSTLKLRADDGRDLTVDVSRVSANVRGGLTPGESVTVSGHEWTSPTALRAEYVQQDSSDASRSGKVASAPSTSASAPSGTSAVPSAAPSARGLRLPRDHQYERYNTGSNTYSKVEVAKVPELIDQNVPIYDRTAKIWVYNTEHKLDPRYGSLGPANPTAANLSLPRDHQYERYDATSATYRKVDVGQVQKLVEEQVPVYDRTAKMWVIDTDKQINPRYAR